MHGTDETELPQWSGFIATTRDALLILEAARRSMIPRVTQRLNDYERSMLASGSVFVYYEHESGMKRWTDGFTWSKSRIRGDFFVYKGPYEADTGTLMKKTFSLTIMGVHLVSYYNLEDLTSGHLHAPSTFPELASLDISPILLERDFVCPTIVQVRSGPHYQAMGGGHSQMAQRWEEGLPAPTTGRNKTKAQGTTRSRRTEKGALPAKRPRASVTTTSPTSSNPLFKFPPPYRISSSELAGQAPARSMAPNEIDRAREASVIRMMDVWSHLGKKYTRRMDEDDIIDLARALIVKDRGVLRAETRWKIGRFASIDEEDEEDEEEEDAADARSSSIDEEDEGENEDVAAAGPSRLTRVPGS